MENEAAEGRVFTFAIIISLPFNHARGLTLTVRPFLNQNLETNVLITSYNKNKPPL